MTASRTAAESSVPHARPAASTPLKQSPAPVVSTTGTLGARTSSSDPSAPVDHRALGSACLDDDDTRWDRAERRSLVLVGGDVGRESEQIVRPRLRWRGVEDRRHVVIAGPLAGRRAPSARAPRGSRAATCGSNVSSAPTTSLGSSAAFAPGATEIWFSPSMPTAMSATPVGRLGVDAPRDRSGRRWRGAPQAPPRPDLSSPTAPSIQTPARGRSPPRWNVRPLRDRPRRRDRLIPALAAVVLRERPTGDASARARAAGHLRRRGRR